MNDYIPKGFKSWHDYYKWQHRCDIIVGIVACLVFVGACILVGD